MIDLNKASIEAVYELIPAGTIVRAKLSINRDVDGNLVTLSRSNDNKYLSFIFTVLDEPYVNMKIFSNVGVAGESKYVYRGMARLRAILESGKGISSNDDSERSKRNRLLESYSELEGLTVQVKVKIKIDPTGTYKDKNDIDRIITPDCEEYVQLSNDPQVLDLRDDKIPF